MSRRRVASRVIAGVVAGLIAMWLLFGGIGIWLRIIAFPYRNPEY